MPEIILLSVFFLTLIITKLRSKEYKFAFSGRVAMAAMLATTGLAHFAFAKGMAMMLPDFIPARMMVVYITGIMELLAAVGLLLPRYVKLTGRLLIVFFVLLLPANIYAAINHVNLQTATYDGDGPGYLWFRIPLQVFFIGWVYLSCIRPSIVIWKLSA